ncbi:MAG: TonB-dependent receptor [Chloroherpetonaceae bacterium]|nr:TonB-dependent receptor [Chloroherpetonaceae bacterium]MCS7212189.1 TonB-dependent receptor [Chloroherpetonaceae bacterium]MDW8018801.1 TonB-dependent receptor [Chloroherpetonaceae bacterium]
MLSLKMNPRKVVKLSLLLAWFSSLHTAVLASGTISGKVVDATSKEPLVGVVIRLEGTAFGAITKTDGRFRIENVPAGEYVLKASFVGYKSLSRTIVVEEGKTLWLVLEMVEGSVETSEIEVTAENYRQPKEDVRTSLYKLEPKQVKNLAGGVEDVLRGLQAVPGVLAANDFSSQLYIRGSGPDQNLMLVDDIEVFNPYRLYGTISMFNPETIADISLITGGFPAKYGDRLSAVLDVSNRDGIRDRFFTAQINANITDANVVAEGKVPFGVEGSWLLSARRTYYDLIVGPILRSARLVEGNTAFPNFADVQLRLACQLAPQHRLQFTGILGRDGIDVISAARNQDQPDSLNVGNITSNDVAGLSWHFRPNANTLSKLTVSWYKNGGSSRFAGNFVDRLNYPQDKLDSALQANPLAVLQLAAATLQSENAFGFEKWNFREDVSLRWGENLLEVGAGVDIMTTSIFFYLRPNEQLRAGFLAAQASGRVGALPLDTTVSQQQSYLRANFYLQNRFEVVDSKLFVQPGVRVDYYQIIEKLYLSPRLNFSFAFDESTTLRGAWGIYVQSPGYEKLIDQQQFIDLRDPEHIRSLRAERAMHFVLGVDRWLDDKWLFKAEAYYKLFDDLIVQRKEEQLVYTSRFLGGDAYNVRNWSTPTPERRKVLSAIPVNDGRGEAYGVELLLEKRLVSSQDRFSGWFSYALAFANRYRDGLTIPFNFDQRHTINIVGSYKFNDWLDLAVRWRYGSGFPITLAIGLQPRIIRNPNGQYVVQEDPLFGRTMFSLDFGGEENINAARLPEYHRLDVRLTAHTEFWGARWDFYLDIINLYNRTNVIGYNHDVEWDVPVGQVPSVIRYVNGMLPIVPTLGISAAF